MNGNERLHAMYEASGYSRWSKEPIQHPHPEVSTLGGQEGWSSHAVEVRRLRWHNDTRGSLVEAHRASWHDGRGAVEPRNTLGEVSQVYISTTVEGVVKGWHLHARQTDRFTVLRGSILLALYDIREHARAIHRKDRAAMPKVHELVLNAERGPSQVTVPAGWAHGWMALHGYGEAVVLNAVSHEYDGTDEWRRAANAGPAEGSWPYDWRRNRDG